MSFSGRVVGGTGPHTWGLNPTGNEKDRGWNDRILRRHSNPDPDSVAGEDFENLSAEQIRALHDKLTSAEQAKQDDALEGELGVAFMAAHPELIRGDYNAAQFVHYFRSRGLVVRSLEMLEKAYQELKAHGLLKINRQVITQQRQNELEEAGRQWAARQEPSEDELYAMPMHELETLAGGRR